MIVDLDRWLAAEQERAPDGHVFAQDMFISHRRFDLPHSLIAALSADGAHPVWDCDLDLRDRRVMQGVARAMRRSRFVALWVSNHFVDSPWCRAEYLNALWVEEKYGIPRALVVCESETALSRIPDTLRGVRQFVMTSGGPSELARFVVSENSVGSETAHGLLRRVPHDRLVQDVGLLSLDEQLNLLEQRALFWVERGTAEIRRSTKESAAVGLTQLMSDSLTEAETIFREVCSIVFESRTSDRRRLGIGPQELSRVVAMSRAIAEGYRHSARAGEMEGLDKWAYDFVLKPLLLAVELEDTRAEAASVYRDVCSSLRRGAVAHEVPTYLSVLEAVETQNQDAASAISHHRVDLYDAHDAYRRNGGA